MVGISLIAGTINDDSLIGSESRDLIRGYSGNDTLDGVTGNDTVIGGYGNDVVIGSDGADKLYGGSDNDEVYGGLGNDYLSGYRGADQLYGGEGNDTLLAGDGDDLLVGGNGRDVLRGGAGADVFLFDAVVNSPYGSPDDIYDFEVNVDKIDITAIGSQFSDLRIKYDAASNRTHVIDDDAGFHIYLRGNHKDLLDADDFITATVAPPPATKAAYYDLESGGAIHAPYEAPFDANGVTASALFELTPATLADVTILFAYNPLNEGYTPEFMSSLDAIDDFVLNGGVFVLHDRYVEGAEDILPGFNSADIMRNFEDDTSINFVNDASALTNGAGGVLNDDSLDDGSSSNHGFVLAGELGMNVTKVHSTSNPDQIVSFAYQYGAGKVYYSSIPLDYYMADDSDIGVNMQAYVDNLAGWALDGADISLL